MSEASRRPHDAGDNDEESPAKARRSARSSDEGNADARASNIFGFNANSALTRGDDDEDDDDSLMDEESSSLYHQLMAQAEVDVRTNGPANAKKGEGDAA